MKLHDAITAVQGSTNFPTDQMQTREIGRIVASDLMSDVLVVHDDDILLLTSLVSEQIVRTADLIGAVGIVIVNGKNIPPAMLDLATSLDVPLIRSPLAKYEACIALAAIQKESGS
jgi:hypothetical protein